MHCAGGVAYIHCAGGLFYYYLFFSCRRGQYTLLMRLKVRYVSMLFAIFHQHNFKPLCYIIIKFITIIINRQFRSKSHTSYLPPMIKDLDYNKSQAKKNY